MKQFIEVTIPGKEGKKYRTYIPIDNIAYIVETENGVLLSLKEGSSKTSNVCQTYDELLNLLK
jgi:hypothetical protein